MQWEMTALPTVSLSQVDEAGCGFCVGWCQAGSGRESGGAQSAQVERQLDVVQPWGVQATLGDPWEL